MAIIVQKFGGTSIADSDKILAAARKAIRAQKEGNQVVMVVSAMGKTTNMLVDLAAQVHESPPAREMDMLLSTGEQVTVALMAMAIRSLGHGAISLTGAQIGIMTDSSHTKARILSISTERMRAALDKGSIVIAAGFQGIDESSNITTLGRGGSDTTAVALAAALEADACEIYTDVDGIYTADPRIVPDARRVSQVSYDEMLELASAGANVMHNRSIEFAKKFSVPIHVRSSFTDTPGTMITARPESEKQAVCGAAVARDEARITVLDIPDRPGAALTLSSKIAEKHIAMDMIVQNTGAEGHANISFTVFRNDLPTAMKAVEKAAKELGAKSFNYDDDVSVVSVVGLGMAVQAGIAEQMFHALAEAGINLLMITTSPIKISVLVSRSEAAEALRIVHKAFALEIAPTEIGEEFAVSARGSISKGSSVSRSNGAAMARLQGMEELIIEDIMLDESEARITLVDMPDWPGRAAEVFGEITSGGIVVDMIVQSFGHDETTNMGFTLPKEYLQKGLELAKNLSDRFGCPPPTHSPRVALLSAVGIGMRSHTEVACRMFQSLAKEGINVQMINTSEMQVTVVVDGSQGEKGLAALKEEFADAMV